MKLPSVPVLFKVALALLFVAQFFVFGNVAEQSGSSSMIVGPSYRTGHSHYTTLSPTYQWSRPTGWEFHGVKWTVSAFFVLGTVFLNERRIWWAYLLAFPVFVWLGFGLPEEVGGVLGLSAIFVCLVVVIKAFRERKQHGVPPKSLESKAS